MRDVKRLIWGVYGVGAASLLYLLVYTAVGLFRQRRDFVPALCRRSLWGSGLTVAIIAMVGFGSAVGFDSLFRAFHEVSFSNDLWKLDPRRDYLVMMFPQGFWVRRHSVRRTGRDRRGRRIGFNIRRLSGLAPQALEAEGACPAAAGDSSRALAHSAGA